MWIRDLTSVKPLEPVHSLNRFGKQTIVREFIPTKEAVAILIQVLASLVVNRPEGLSVVLPSKEQTLRSFLVRANFGTGKTILQLALGEMLSALGDASLFGEWHSLFHNYPDLQRLYAQLRAETGGRPFVVLLADLKEKGGTPLRDVIVRALLDWVKGYDHTLRTGSEFDLAIENLSAASERMPERLAVAVAKLAPGLSLDELLSLLESWDRRALEIAYAVMAEAAGFAADRNRVEMRTYYEEIRRQVQGQIGGIVLLCDELHHYLTTSASFQGLLAGALADLDCFAVYVNETKHDQLPPMLLVGSVHENLGAYLRTAGASGDAFEQAKGRFREHSLTSSLSQTELICGAFRPNHDAFEVLTQELSIAAQAQILASQSPAGTTWRHFFPLHPTVVTTLPTLARRLAQNDRTTFHFLGFDVRRQVEEGPSLVDGRLNLITLPAVYDYFVAAIEERDPAVLKAVQMAVQYCNGGELHERVMKTFACLHIAGSVSTEEGEVVVRQAISPDQMARFLNQPVYSEVKEALDDLVGSGYLHRTARMEYVLHVGGGLSQQELERRVQARMNEVDPDVWALARLQDSSMRRRTIMGPAKIKDRVAREFRVYILSVAEAAKFNSPVPPAYAGHLIFVIPSCGMSEEAFRTAVEPHLARLQCLGAIVALPRRWEHLDGDLIRRQEALRIVLQSTRSVEEKQRITETLERLENEVRARLEEFGQAGNWVFETAFGPMQSTHRLLNDMLAQVVERLYPRFPEFRSSSMDSAAAFYTLLDRFLLNPVGLKCDATTKSKAEQVLVAVGLAVQSPSDPAVISLAAPSNAAVHPNAVAVWELLEKTDWSGQTPIADLYDQLELPPYGLPRHLTDIFVGAWLRLKGAVVKGSRSGLEYPEVNSKLVKEIGLRRDDAFRIDVPQHLDPELMAGVAPIWAAIGQSVGTTRYLVATDPGVTPRKKMQDLLDDMNAFSQKLMTELIGPAQTLGRPDAEGEALVAKLTRIVSDRTDSPESFFREVVCTLDAVSVKALSERLAGHGALAALAALIESVRNLPAVDSELAPDLAMQRDRLTAAARALDPTDAEGIRKVRSALEQFRTDYLTRYATAHDELNAVRSRFGHALLEAPIFGLLRLLSGLKFPSQVATPATADDLERRVLTGRGSLCKETGATRLAAGHGWLCPQCQADSSELWAVEEEIARLVELERRLETDLDFALQEWAKLLWQVLDDELPRALGIEPLIDQDEDAYVKLRRAAKSLTRVVEHSGTVDEASEHLKAVLGPLKVYLSGARADGRRPKRKTLQELADMVEEQLAERGLELLHLDQEDPADQRMLIAVLERVVSESATNGLVVPIRRKRHA